MASNSINIYNFYFRYLWTQDDFTSFQSALFDSFQGLAEGMTGGAIVNGCFVRRSGSTTIQVGPGIAISPSGRLMVTTANTSLPFTKPVGFQERALIVMRPKDVDNTPITSPTDPNSTVNLRKQLTAEIVLVRGTPALSPDYPAKGADDVILCGVTLDPTFNLNGNSDFDWSIREIWGRNRNNQRMDHSFYDDRLRPYRLSAARIGIKPAIIGMSQFGATPASPLGSVYVGPGATSWSIFPRGSFETFNLFGGDAILDFATGTITGGDEVSPDFAVAPIGGSGYYTLGLVQIDVNDRLSVKYNAFPGFDKNNELNTLLNSEPGSSLALDPDKDKKIICYFILNSADGITWTDVEVYDWRSPSNVALPSNITRKNVELSYNQTWVAPPGVQRVRVSLYQTKLNQVSAGLLSCAAIDSAGAGYAWGANAQGQLGDGTTAAKSSPVAIAGGKVWKSISVGNGLSGDYMLGIDSNDDGYAWGDNFDGQLGVGDTVNRSTPVIIPGGRKWRSLVAGRTRTSAGITLDGDGFMWGNGDDGERGDGTFNNASSPVAISGSFKWKQIAPGNNFTIGLTTDGTPYGWGSNNSGRAGLNASASTPVAVNGSFKFREVAVGRSNNGWVLALEESGNIYWWGEGDSSGAIGKFFDVSSPFPVWTDRKFRRVRGSRSFAAAIDDGGRVLVWGNNSDGQIGDGTTSDQSSPFVMAGGRKFVDIQVNADSSSTFNSWVAAIAPDGTLYTWGYGGDGQLGSGATASRSSPVAVAGTRTYQPVYDTLLAQADVDVTPGDTHTLQIFQGVAFFAGVSLAVTKYNCKVVLEYFE